MNRHTTAATLARNSAGRCPPDYPNWSYVSGTKESVWWRALFAPAPATSYRVVVIVPSDPHAANRGLDAGGFYVARSADGPIVSYTRGFFDHAEHIGPFDTLGAAILAAELLW